LTSGVLRAERGWVTAVMAVSWGLGGWRETGGAPWAGGSVSWRAALRGFKQAARRTAGLMAVANGAKRSCCKGAVSGDTGHCVAH
jgi:hypothetical protein